MAEASRRAAKPAAKGGLPNARFILAAAEALSAAEAPSAAAAPTPLTGCADLVSVRFPWGSLLRGMVGREGAIAEGVAGLVAPGGTLELLLAPADRDGLDGIPTEPTALVDAVGSAFGPHGLALEIARPATAQEVAASHSTWAKRLGSARDGDRVVMLMRLQMRPDRSIER